MDIQTEKLQLVKRLLDTDDESILQQVKDVFDTHEKDFWNELPDIIKKGIERSRQQADAGLLTPHEDVIKKYAKYL